MAKNGKVLLAGPWVGEFGWELFCWQGFVRMLSPLFEKTIIISRPGHKYIYEDFCSEYIEFDPKSYKTRKHQCFVIDPEVDSATERVECSMEGALEIIKNIRHDFYFTGAINLKAEDKTIFRRQQFYKYDFKSGDGYDLILHCRNKSTGGNRNWNADNWQELYDSLPKNLNVACIGNSEALHLHGTKDLRGLDVKQVVGVLNSSKLIVGPSSGPMHLASLCGMPHVVWGREDLRMVYESWWNPFGAKAIYHSKDDWNPSPSTINKLIIDHI